MIKIALKITFLNDDSGVSSELEKMRKLIEGQSRVTEAITLKYVLKSEKHLAEMLIKDCEQAERLQDLSTKFNFFFSDVNDSKMRKVTTERIDTLAKTLSVTAESIQEARRTMQTMKERLLDGSTRWLQGHWAYKEWKSSNTESIPVLLLSGEPKTGKSCLLAAIDEEIRATLPDVDIAYFAFAERDVKDTRDKGKDDLPTALKSMALQIAGQNTTYAKDLAVLKESEFKSTQSVKDLWDKLQFSKYSQVKDGTGIILMFDGVREPPEDKPGTFAKLLGAILRESRSPSNTVPHRLRIIATGPATALENIASPVKPIPIAEHSERDIEAYIAHELDRDEALQGQHLEMRDLRISIQRELPKVAHGSFSIVQQKLERIRQAVESDAYLDDVRLILYENPEEDLGKLARKTVNDLQAKLQAHEIEQLNELLNWLIFGRRYFEIDELRAAAFLNSQRSPLQPFDKKLKKKYMDILHLRDNVVEVDPEVESLFKNAANVPGGKEAVLDGDDPRITMTISISQADLRTVQQFCWDLTERVGIGRFDFIATSPSVERKGIIHCEESRAQFQIARQLLKLLNDEPHENSKCLADYALNYLLDHLEEVKVALDKNKLGDAERKEIAERLIDLLSDVEGIEKFWNTTVDVYFRWIALPRVSTIREWLTDARTKRVLEPKERRWVEVHTGTEAGMAGFYKPITLMMSRRWLQGRDWNAHDIYQWIQRYVALVG